MKNIKFKEYLTEQLKDTNFKKEWDSLEQVYNSIVSCIKNNNETNTTDRCSKHKGTSYD